MTAQISITLATVTLARRLAVLQDLWHTPGPRATPEGENLFDAMADLVPAVTEDDRAWLLVIGVAAVLPDHSLVHAVRRNLAHLDTDQAVLWLLSSVAPLARHQGRGHADLRLITDRPVLEVSSLLDGDGSPSDRRLLSASAAHWAATRELECVVWAPGAGTLQSLDDDQRSMLIDGTVERAGHATSRPPRQLGGQIVVPWGVPVLVTGTPSAAQSDRLAAMAELTPCTVRLVGRDCAPVSSAETVSHRESADFCQYLELVKHADVVVTASTSATAGFAGFAGALVAQGLGGPHVRTCPLPTTLPQPRPDQTVARPPASARAIVVAADQPGDRIDRAVVLESAELLWREGLDFEVTLLVSHRLGLSVADEVAHELQSQGRPLRVELDPTPAQFASVVSRARCLVHPTLREGYGLPVLEALAAGVPVITADFGTAREAAEGRGGLVVDLTDVEALTSSLRSLLTDEGVRADLAAQAAERPVRTVKDYAEDLWEVLLG